MVNKILETSGTETSLTIYSPSENGALDDYRLFGFEVPVQTLLLSMMLCLVLISALLLTAQFQVQPQAVTKTATTEVQASNFRADIQGLRAVAVMSVLVYHMRPTLLPGGFTGVDIFFVVSGYVVTPQLLRASSGNANLPSFFARRAKRLLPILLTVVVSTSLILTLVATVWGRGSSRFLKIGAAGLLANANNWMILAKVDYWTTDLISHDYNPFVHLWSLGVEEQFYLLMPAILFLPGGRDHRGVQLAALIITIAGSILLSWYFWKSGASKSCGFYLLFSRYWELGSGAALVCVSEELTRMLVGRRLLQYTLDVLAVLLLIISLRYCPDDGGSFPCPWALVPVAGTLCCLAAGLSPRQRSLNAFLSSRVCVYIGDMSYSIYLWHVPVLATMAWLTDSGKSSVANLVLCFGVTMALSAASFHLIEQPFRKTVFACRWRVIGVALLSTVSGVLFLAMLSSYRELQIFSEIESFKAPASLTGLYARHSCRCNIVQPGLIHVPPAAVTGNASQDELPQCFYPSSVPLSALFPGLLDCWLSVYTDPLRCVSGPNGPRNKTEPVLYLIGDSHVRSLTPAFQAASSRPVVLISYYLGSVELIEKQLREVVDNNDLVVYAHYFDPRTDTPRSTFRPEDARTQLERFNASVQTLSNITEGVGAKLLLIGDTPTLRTTVETCSGHTSPSPCAVPASQNYTRAYNDIVQNFAKLSGVYHFDTLPLLCHGQVCDFSVPGTSSPARIDSHHLSAAASLYISPFLCSFLQESGLQ
eukprot:TRINITY_DN13288_c0_g1_i4.p1 TRINITY_DN13288_c0_g1~~TRINITY_DN13288_c0_g1_i4.p1  ORF type:complete len:837 (+),score=62.36 TRINITY_DN13288_c0_g1_i4:226-2511(+)